MTGVWGDGMACVSAGKAAEEFAKVGIVECMAFSSDGRFLGVSTADGALAIFDWHTGRLLNVLRSAAASVHSFKPVSRVCAAGLCCSELRVLLDPARPVLQGDVDGLQGRAWG